MVGQNFFFHFYFQRFVRVSTVFIFSLLINMGCLYSKTCYDFKKFDFKSCEYRNSEFEVLWFFVCFSHNLTFSILEDLTYAIKGTKEINYLKPHEDNITLYLISSALSGLCVWLHPYCVYILRVYVF